MTNVRAMHNPGAINVTELESIFQQGTLIRGQSVEYKPGFFEKIKLAFSKQFQIKFGGENANASWWFKVRTLFSKKFVIRKDGGYIGRGFFEQDLIQIYGFTKKELAKLVSHETLMRTTTVYQGGWRTTYVFRMHIPKEELPKC